ncbi:hypothetical protein M501DRAFT_929464 [Patellaria atrata CBS 101060]|uniref:MINDY deubiquitinase domain-containing protein n=1 Tax=Patellaria atrata CBS 101060 TaxID=1346257 RepID=A0A9P4SH18_9PEZI|nr:hypothetical protein M501DRAFT_929464 [Patellaria atrata CBS 101060]
MTIRRPGGDTGDLVPPPLSRAANDPPYPTEPTMFSASIPNTNNGEQNPQSIPPPTTSTGSNFTLTSIRNELHSPRPESDMHSINSGSDWEDSDDEELHKAPSLARDIKDLPAPLKVGGIQAPRQGREREAEQIPSALRVGPPGGAPALKRLQESLASDGGIYVPLGTSPHESSNVPLRSHNPYLRVQNTGQSSYFGGESSASIWGDSAPQSQSHSQFHSNFQSHPAELPSERTPVEQTSNMSLNNSNLDAPTSSSNQPPLIPTSTEQNNPHHEERHDSNASSEWNPGMDVSSLDAFTSRAHGLPSDHQRTPPPLSWDEQREGEETARTAAMLHTISLEDQPPKLPPRRSQEEQAPPKPPRPQLNVNEAASLTTRSEVETPNARVARQRKEHYQIKHIRWYDSVKRGIRPSPILTQSANGPCPLVALVNVLVLTTPVGIETALIDTLRTREQVSLGLLLDAVSDELVSRQHGTTTEDIPDMSELYKFLITLHTGMNVNPRFVASDGTDTDNDKLTRPIFNGRQKPGGFEQTFEMKLYSTFGVPLIHGWLPKSKSRAYEAFERSAKTYEDTQNILFGEEELEGKLRANGLTPQEQTLYEDLTAIKQFLALWPTQLSDHGLDIIATNLKPGEFAILFRNDHFSTLYKEPRSEQLLTLVTDAGYSTHDEIVWESLVDVSGRGSELYSGDFRPVSHADPADTAPAQGHPPLRSLLDDDSGWQTVPPRRSQHTPPPSSTVRQSSSAAVQQSRTEQEDHDLALALQLQEEEDDRALRAQESRRRQESHLSEQYLASSAPPRPQGQEPRPHIPPRRSNLPGPATANPARDDAPPPTYAAATASPPASPYSPGYADRQFRRGGPEMGWRPQSGVPPRVPLPRRGTAGSGQGMGPQGRGQVQQQQQQQQQQQGGGKDKCVVM